MTKIYSALKDYLTDIQTILDNVNEGVSNDDTKEIIFNRMDLLDSEMTDELKEGLDEDNFDEDANGDDYVNYDDIRYTLHEYDTDLGLSYIKNKGFVINSIEVYLEHEDPINTFDSIDDLDRYI